MKLGAWLNWEFNGREHSKKLAEEVFAVRHFTMAYKNLIQSPKMFAISKAADLNWLAQGGQLYWAFLLVRVPWPRPYVILYNKRLLDTTRSGF